MALFSGWWKQPEEKRKSGSFQQQKSRAASTNDRANGNPLPFPSGNFRRISAGIWQNSAHETRKGISFSA